MKITQWKGSPGFGAIAMAFLAVMVSAPALAVDVETIVDPEVDGEERFEAVQNAAELGAEAVEPLAVHLDAENVVIRRAARQALESIVHHAGRPQADEEQRAVARALAECLDDEHTVAVRREVLHLLAWCADHREVEAIAPWLEDPELVDAACYALVANPSRASVRALVNALDRVEDEASRTSIIHALAQKANAATEPLTGSE
ncbi:MAG: hypothetical protein R6W89_09540 [Candidatus Hydrogenedentota bacterium]